MSQHIDWKVGDRLVCVDDSPARSHLYKGRKFLRAGKVYVVREVFVSPPGWADAGTVGVRLEEIRGYFHRNGEEIGFGARRFRKVQPRKTDISIFTAMLHDKRSEVDA